MAMSSAPSPKLYSRKAMAPPPPPSIASLAAEPMVEASQSLPNLDGTAKVQCDQPRNQEPERGGDKGGRPRVPVDKGVTLLSFPRSWILPWRKANKRVHCAPQPLRQTRTGFGIGRTISCPAPRGRTWLL